jgi:hypothetical protein
LVSYRTHPGQDTKIAVLFNAAVRLAGDSFAALSAIAMGVVMALISSVIRAGSGFDPPGSVILRFGTNSRLRDE